MIQSFIHLHAHSYFSLMEGLVSPDGLVTTARKNGMEAIALTDHKCLSGAVEFENACVKNGIQPIYGMDEKRGMVKHLQAQQPFNAG